MELNMQIFNQRIKGIAQSKALAKFINKMEPKVGYQYLTREQQTALILALVNEHKEVRDLVTSTITEALQKAYRAELGEDEAEIEADREETRRMIEDDNRQRARDLNSENKRYHYGY
jgi:hypothetical protein